MFNRTKLYKEDINLLKKQIAELNENLKGREDKLQHFLNELHIELLTVIEQHNDINSQHDLLAQMVGVLLGQFNEVEQTTKNANNVSKDILIKGKTLISSSHNMVVISKDGKQAVDKILNLINDLGVQSQSTSSGMTQLSERSKEIENIVGVIKQISEQTNLLALNASIEAARAGEHGKGFAVVAEEVRKLAETTNQSTSSISTLITQIQTEITAAFNNNQHNIDLIKEGIQLSSLTAEQINYLLTNIQDVEKEVIFLLKGIEEQRNLNDEVIQKFSNSTSLFDKINKVIIEHIEDADVVGDKLLKGVEKVRNFSLETEKTSLV
ncbi:methyl-accepting chemotaxis protein [Niallia sp. NCCP-28]|uniref:methyl-accepting chemotaxis protein n=1 Tax=Niallia sp. NCCP-28 TaxID=2934712 RepID=UPI002080D497|nr:methyl-accepting chemotaxis protein [Niallia sp. NCCP-28]GKU82187.1 methyl-accepting chemotaxis protein [Niallia sp. NCCP-28]